MSLPTYSTSLSTSVTRVQQNAPFPQFVVGARNAGTYKLLKKNSTYGSVISLWRSPVYQIGKDFDILGIEFNIVGGLTSGKALVPVLYFDNASSSSTGATINLTNYPNFEEHIILSSKNFDNAVHGRLNFFFELEMTGTVLTVPRLPITIKLEVEDT